MGRLLYYIVLFIRCFAYSIAILAQGVGLIAQVVGAAANLLYNATSGKPPVRIGLPGDPRPKSESPVAVKGKPVGKTRTVDFAALRADKGTPILEHPRTVQEWGRVIDPADRQVEAGNPADVPW